jgi:perosamine synthetase
MSKIDLTQLTIYDGSTLRDAMQAISNGQIGIALVFEAETKSFVRLLTDGDIRRALLKGFGLQASIDVIEGSGSVTIGQKASSAQISSLFSDQIRVLPVLDDSNQVVDLYFHDKRNHLAVAKPFFDDEEIELVNECMVTGWVSSGGKFVRLFEEMVAGHSGTKYAVSCSSGTSALHLLLLSHGIGEGDEVIVPTLTFIATANAVRYTGATPIFVDSDLDSWNIDPKNIESATNDKTKAIIAVHLYGHPADMDPINQVAEKYNLKVFEDAAEAQGAFYKGRRVGSLADGAIFSFFGNKVITTGEGGMILTNDEEIAQRCRILRDHGMSSDKRYWHEIIGYNYRMTNIQAALGVAQMKKIDRIVEKKKSIALEYSKQLKDVKGITLPPNQQWADNIYWLYTILVDESIAGFNISSLISALKDNDIDSRRVFYPMHTQPIYKSNQVLPVSEKIHEMGISLPSAPGMSSDDIARTCEVIRALS